MTLLVPRFGGLVVPQHNFVATPSTAAIGTTVTGGAANTMGSWATIIASTDHDAFGFNIAIAGSVDPNLLSNILFDVGIGGAGSERIVLPYVNMGQSNGLGQGNIINFTFPVFVPKGSRIAIRHQSNIASQTGTYAITLYGGSGLPPWEVYRGVETIGAVPASSRGTLHTLGSSGAYSTYADIGSPITHDWDAFVLLFGQGTDTTMTSNVFYGRVGIGGNTLWQGFYSTINVEYCSHPANTPLPVSRRIPSGSQLQVQGTCSGAADADLGVTIMGFWK